MTEEPETKELRIEQGVLEDAERERAEESELPTEEHTHERRADKHAYLREKLDERARSEQEADD
jgi:hypothetical protein